MRRNSIRLTVILALSFAGFLQPYIWTPQTYAASETNVEVASKRLGFEEAYLPTLDGIIAESRKFGMFSGRKNRDTEELRIRLIRERVVAGKSDVLGKTRESVAETLSDEELAHLLANLVREDGKIDDPKASETREIVVKLYRDAIFNAIMASVVPVQEQADKMVEAGEATK